LESGKYDVKLQIKPHTFSKFEGDGKPVETNWPKDELPVEEKPKEVKLSFNVAYYR
jgi:hypothetical protein